MMEEYRNSQEYIDAFAQYIKSGDDEEIRALLTENVSGTVPVPEFVYDVVKTAWTKDGIMNLVRKSYLKGNLKVGYEIASSGAVIHQEGGDPIDEEQLTLGIVHLVPRNIKKYIAISDELYDLSSRDFLTYVYSELTYQIAKKCGETLIERIVSLSTQSNVPVVDYIDSAITTSTVAMALSKLSDEAVNPVVVMNKGSWGFFKKEQYDNKFGVDVFEGLPVVFNNALKPYNEATTGETFAIVGDFGNGALANYPNGEEVLLKTDELTLAQQDLIKIIGRQYVAVDVVAPKHFAVVNKGDEVTPIVPTGNIEITENTAEGSPLNIAQYATATVNVSGGGTPTGEEVTIAENQTVLCEYYEEDLYGGGIEIETAVPYGVSSITVIYDGVTYNVTQNAIDGWGASYDDETGLFDFSVYPFCLFDETGEILTNTEGNHTIEAYCIRTTITILENGDYDVTNYIGAYVNVPEPIPFEKEVYPKQTFTPTLSSGKYTKTLTDASLNSYTNSVIVSYNNTDYTCSVNTSGSELSPIRSVGDPDFVNYPFYIVESTSGFPPTTTVIAQFADGSQVTLGITTYVITPSGTLQIRSNVLTSCSGYDQVKVLVYSGLESVKITRTDNIDASVEFHSALAIDTTYNTVTEYSSPFISKNESKTFKVPLISNVSHDFFFTYPTGYTLSVTGLQTSVQTVSLTTENVAMVTQVNGWHDMTITLS